MTRRLIFIPTFVLTLAIAATAWAGSFSDNQYQGRIEADHGTYFGFDVSKQNGVTKVKRIETVVKVQCTNGESGPLTLRGTKSIRVKKNDSFHKVMPGVGLSVRGSIGPALLRITGKLQSGGKAKGTIDADYYFAETRGGTRVHCYSGAVDWKTKRGAVVNPEGRGAGRSRLR